MAKENAAVKRAAIKYSKEQLIRSDRYMKRRDLLGALLKDDERYTFTEVDAMVDHYMKGKVK
ncbi:MAG: hypothetical protein IJY93_01260 [Clostridia bacterium]|nr:hypothetical protein [Clostridia bacterium]